MNQFTPDFGPINSGIIGSVNSRIINRRRVGFLQSSSIGDLKHFRLKHPDLLLFGYFCAGDMNIGIIDG